MDSTIAHLALLSRARHPWLDWIGWVGLGKGQNSLQSGLRYAQLAPNLDQRHTGPPQLNGCKLLLLLELKGFLLTLISLATSAE